MSAEVEKGNNEETNGQTNGATDVISTTIEKPRKPLKQLLLDNWQIIIKLIELVSKLLHFLYLPKVKNNK